VTQLVRVTSPATHRPAVLEKCSCMRPNGSGVVAVMWARACRVTAPADCISFGRNRRRSRPAEASRRGSSLAAALTYPAPDAATWRTWAYARGSTLDVSLLQAAPYRLLCILSLRLPADDAERITRVRRPLAHATGPPSLWRTTRVTLPRYQRPPSFSRSSAAFHVTFIFLWLNAKWWFVLRRRHRSIRLSRRRRNR